MTREEFLAQHEQSDFAGMVFDLTPAFVRIAELRPDHLAQFRSVIGSVMAADYNGQFEDVADRKSLAYEMFNSLVGADVPTESKEDDTDGGSDSIGE